MAGAPMGGEGEHRHARVLRRQYMERIRRSCGDGCKLIGARLHDQGAIGKDKRALNRVMRLVEDHQEEARHRVDAGSPPDDLKRRAHRFGSRCHGAAHRAGGVALAHHHRRKAHRIRHRALGRLAVDASVAAEFMIGGGIIRSPGRASRIQDFDQGAVIAKQFLDPFHTAKQDRTRRSVGCDEQAARDAAHVLAFRQDDPRLRGTGSVENRIEETHIPVSSVTLQASQCSPARMKIARKMVSPTINAIACPPTPRTVRRDVFMPTAAIAISSAQREILPRLSETISGISPIEFAAARTRKAQTKPGISGGRALVPVASASALSPARIASEKTSTTGASMVTRISFTSVAVSPVCSETEKPAPKTCATSWVVPPRKTPVAVGSRSQTWMITG